ncbi:MAG: glycosyltransferase family 10 [Acholeplasmataceae bacterium]|nr:glycosyltransferase family 10 [Acholeplasmataceae bacterium]
MLKVKVSSSDNLAGLLNQTPGGKGIWKNCQFFLGDNIQECDYWVVFNGVSREERVICPPNHIILVTGEPASVKMYSQKFLSQFSRIITAQESLKHPNVIHVHQPLQWLLHKNYDELQSLPMLEKTKTMSLICSNKRFTKGHEERYQFALELKGYFGDKIDLYGRGIRDFDDKWDVIAPYKYTIAIENSSSKYYVSEKLWENYLSLTYPFYFGCTNVGEYYPPESYSLIDIHDFEGTIDVIERVLGDSDHYERHVPVLLEARRRFLGVYHVFPQLYQVINDMDLQESDLPVKKNMVLYPDNVNSLDILLKWRSIVQKAHSVFSRI